MGDDLEAFVAQLKNQHADLTARFLSAQSAQRAATKACRDARDALVAFRQRYGGHLKLIDAGSVTVEE